MRTSTSVPGEPRIATIPLVAGTLTEIRAAGAVSSPTLHSLVDLPQELWMVLARYVLSHSPYLSRPGDEPLRFPVVGAMRDLRSLSFTCSALNRIAAGLRLKPEFSAWAELAGRTEYELGLRAGLDPAVLRIACSRRYGHDPLRSGGAPHRIGISIASSAQLASACKVLNQAGAQVLELQLHLNLAPEAEMTALGQALMTCSSLRGLQISSDKVLLTSWVAAASVLPALDKLVLKAGSLETGALAWLGKGALAGRLQGLELTINRLQPEDMQALAGLAEKMRQLKFLDLGGAALNLDCCTTLAAALKNFVALQGLYVGQENGAVDVAGAQQILKSILDDGRLTRLGLHRLAPAPAHIALDLLKSLSAYSLLQELSWGGPLATEATKFLCGFAGRAGLRSLVLDGCGLKDSHWAELSRSLTLNTGLRELRIVNETLPEKIVKGGLATAIESCASLMHLTLENCSLTHVAATRLARAIARNPSMLVLQVLLRATDGEANAVTRAFSKILCQEGNLLQFDVSREVNAGWIEMQERLRRNRLRFDIADGVASTSTTGT